MLRFAVYALSCGLACLGFAATIAQAEIYRWVDASGRMHFTHDLGKVPSEHRPAAKSQAEAKPKRDPIQRYQEPAPARGAPVEPLRPTSGESATHRVRVQRAGTSMAVMVTLNDRLQVPFIIDTGASDVLVPMWAARELGLELTGPGVRTKVYQTANGIIETPVVNLESVDLGGARVEHVPGSVSSSMRMGLLGLSFFNNFDYQINAAHGIVTLTENNLRQDGLIRGGRSMNQWRSEFMSLESRLEHAEGRRGSTTMSSNRREEIEGLRRQLEILEAEADDARVPTEWRR
jgi:clan AA aspartic protease (TIGR02281 family)